MLPSLQTGGSNMFAGMSISGVSSAPAPRSSRDGSQSERGTAATGAAQKFVQKQSAARFFPHLGPAPVSLSLAAIHGRTAQGSSTSRQSSVLARQASNTLPAQLSPALTAADSSSSTSSAPASNHHSLRHAAYVAVATTSPNKDKSGKSPVKRKSSKNTKNQEEEKALPPGATADAAADSASASHIPSDGQQTQSGALFRRVSIDAGMPSAAASTFPALSPRALLNRAPSSVVPGSMNAVGVGPPAHVRRISVNIHDVLESPRLRKMSPTSASQVQEKHGALSRKPSLLSQPSRLGVSTPQQHQQHPHTERTHGASSSPTSAAAASASTSGGKPCSVLMCTHPRLPHEIYCTAHHGDARIGLKLQHKRSGSVLQRMLNPTLHKSAHAGGYGAAGQRPHTNNKADKNLSMHAQGIGHKHGLADLNAYDLIANDSLLEEDEEELEAKQAAARRKRELDVMRREKAANSTTYTPHRKNSKTLLQDVVAAAAASVAKTIAPEEVEQSPTKDPKHAAEFFTRNPSQRRYSMSKEASTSSDWLHTPGAQAARLLRIASKPQIRPESDSQRSHSRKISFGLPVEPLPSVDVSLAQLPFIRLYFDLPTSLESFLEFQGKVSSTPEGGALCFIVALLLWSEGKDQRERAALKKQLHVRISGEVDDEDEEGDEDYEKDAVFEDEERLAISLAQANLPLHVISNNSSRRGLTDFTPLITPRGANGQPLNPAAKRLASFHKPAVHQKKIVFTSSKKKNEADAVSSVGEEGEEKQESSSSGAGGKDHSNSSRFRGAWTMDMRWMALIACIHADQTVEHKRMMSSSSTSSPAQIEFRNRSLCEIDVESLENSYDVCPHLARSYIVGTSPSDHFALPKCVPPTTPPMDKRKMKFSGAASKEGDASTQYWEEQAAAEVNEYKSCLALMGEGCGSLVVRLARHPFASGTAEQTLSNPFSLVMLHNSGLKYPKSMKLRKDPSTGRWKVVHWFNLLIDVPLAQETYSSAMAMATGTGTKNKQK